MAFTLPDLYEGRQVGPDPAAVAPTPPPAPAPGPGPAPQLSPEDWKAGFLRFMQGDTAGIHPELIADYTQWKDRIAAKQTQSRARHLARKAQQPQPTLPPGVGVRPMIPDETGQAPGIPSDDGRPQPVPGGPTVVPSLGGGPGPGPRVEAVAKAKPRAKDIRNISAAKKGKPKITK